MKNEKEKKAKKATKMKGIPVLVLLSVLTTSPVVAFAAEKTVSAESMVTQSAQAIAQSYLMSPDAPVTFKLPLNANTLKDLKMTEKNGTLSATGNSKKAQFGVLITGASGSQLATLQNGMLSLSTDGTTIQISASHPMFDRYATYTSYLLSGSDLNKYEASVNSGGNASSFETYVKKAAADGTLQQASIQTGSTIGEAAQWEMTNELPDKVLASDGVTVSVDVTDDYGNAATDGTIRFVNATDANGEVVEDVTTTTPTVELVDGKAAIEITAEKTNEVTLHFETEGTYAEEAKELTAETTFVQAAPEGSKVSVVGTTFNTDGSTTITGNVTLDGTTVAEVGVPLVTGNGTLSDALPITDENGNFSVTLDKLDEATVATVELNAEKTPGVTMPDVSIAPAVKGDQAFAATGMTVEEANTLIKLTLADGSWADNLYAKVGENGTPVKVGADGGFVAGAAGEIYLGAYNATYVGDVNCVLSFETAENAGLSSEIHLTAADKINADGKATTTISGKVVYGDYALVDGVVQLAASKGTLSQTTLKTNATGDYSAVLTAGTAAGIASITASNGDVSQTASIEFVAVSTSRLKVDLNYFRTYNYGVEYSLDQGETWKKVWIYNTFNDFVYDEVHDTLIGYGKSGKIWTSTDGLNWTLRLNNSDTTFYGFRDMAVSDDGTVVAAYTTFDSSRPTTTYLDGSRYKESVTLYISKDGGLTWRKSFSANNFVQSTYIADDEFQSLTYEDGIFTSILNDTQTLVSYDNGTFWTDHRTDQTFHTVQFLSKDTQTGVSTKTDTLFECTYFTDFAFADGAYSATITGTTEHITSTDGVNWINPETGKEYLLQSGIVKTPYQYSQLVSTKYGSFYRIVTAYRDLATLDFVAK